MAIGRRLVVVVVLGIMALGALTAWGVQQYHKKYPSAPPIVAKAVTPPVITPPVIQPPKPAVQKTQAEKPEQPRVVAKPKVVRKAAPSQKTLPSHARASAVDQPAVFCRCPDGKIIKVTANPPKPSKLRKFGHGLKQIGRGFVHVVTLGHK